MSNINRNNYEAFLLDYVEQNLSPKMVAELMLFLTQNPDLKAELNEFENTLFTRTPTTEFKHKLDLKKLVIEELMIAEIEGLNTTDESKELKQAIKENAAFASLFANYQKSILVPENIVFENKEALKQTDTKIVPLFYWVASAAAVLLLFLLMKDFKNDTVEQIATTTQQVENKLNRNHEVEIDQKNEQIAKVEEVKTVKQITSKSKGLSPITKKPTTSSQQPIISKEMIEIEPYQEKEYIEIEPFVVEEIPNQAEKFLTVSEVLKKEALNELVAANLVAKVLGKNAEVETKENEQGKIEEYALNIGEFSFSRKIRK